MNVITLKLLKGILVVLSVIYIFSTPLVAEDQGYKSFTFRNTKWGMTMDEVIERKGEPDYEPGDEPYLGPEDFIGYSGLKVEGLDTYLGYTFEEGKLVGTIYDFQESYDDKNHYVKDFKKIRELLTGKYGHPEFERKIWNRDRYKGEPRKFGAALSSGDLEYYVKWETEETEILMILRKEKGEIDHSVTYYSKEFRASRKENSEEGS